MSFKRHVEDLADYNRWANARLYADAAGLAEERLHEDVGVYFGSLFGTLRHLFDADRAWSFLLRGGALADLALSAAPDTFAGLAHERRLLDEHWTKWLGGVDEAWLDQPFEFTSALGQWKGLSVRGSRASILAHVFNHQTHHRGQAHAALTRLGVHEPNALDLIAKGMLGE